MKIQDKMTHWEVAVRAGQKKATRGKAGFSCLVWTSRVMVPLELLEEMSALRFLRGLWDEGVDGIF